MAGACADSASSATHPQSGAPTTPRPSALFIGAEKSKTPGRASHPLQLGGQAYFLDGEGGRAFEAAPHPGTDWGPLTRAERRWRRATCLPGS